MHRAPWPNTSISMGERWQMYSIWSRDSSRDRTTRLATRSAHRFTPSKEWMVSWVEAWMGRSGTVWRSIRITPRSWTITASTPMALAWAATSAAPANSRSVSRVFRVRWTLHPRRWQ